MLPPEDKATRSDSNCKQQTACWFKGKMPAALKLMENQQGQELKVPSYQFTWKEAVGLASAARVTPRLLQAGVAQSLCDLHQLQQRGEASLSEAFCFGEPPVTSFFELVPSGPNKC